MLHRVGSLDAGLKGDYKPYEGHGVSLKMSFALSTAAAFSIQTAKPRANAQQDSKGMEQSAQAGGAGSAESLCGLRDPTGPQELVPATGGNSHVTEQLTVPSLHGWGVLVWDGRAVACIFHVQLHCIRAVVCNLESNWSQLLALKVMDLID